MSAEPTDYEAVADFRSALRHFLRASEDVLRAHGLTPRRYDLLVMIHAAGDEGATINSLAERLALAANSVTELVDRAQEAGLVSRAADPGDRRAIRVSLTRDGRARLAAAVSALQPQRLHLLNLLADIRTRLRAATLDRPR